LAIPPLVYVGFNLVFTPLFLASGFRALKFNSQSMETTLQVGDQFIIDQTYYGRHRVGRNDLVVMRREGYQTVKRVIAIGGDTIEGKDRQVMVNGQVVVEPFVQHSGPGINPQLDTFDAVAVPAGKYFVMGDNRDISLDSRMPKVGLVDAQAIVGKPLYIYRSPATGRVSWTLD
jgi:signal peptidase I